MISHVDCGVCREASHSADVLATTHEPTAMRPNGVAELPKVESLEEPNAIQANLALSSAIDCLRDDLISLYVAADKIHWHLRVKRHEVESWSTFLDQAEVARQLSGNILRAIIRSVCIKENLGGEGECDALLKAVLALQAENQALASSAAP